MAGVQLPVMPNAHETLYPSTNTSDQQPMFDEKWGTHLMGTPAVPTCHPNNQKAALWGAADQKQIHSNHYPYLQYTPIQRTTAMDSVLLKFNSWSSKAESTANNIWHNRMRIIVQFSTLITCIYEYVLKQGRLSTEQPGQK